MENNMASAKIYWTDMRARVGDSLLTKTERLVKAAGIESIDFNNKFVAIKIHFGEPGNLAFLRPNWAKTIADYVKRLGGKPFLTDCNTLYVGRRNQALLHLDAAMENGYSPLSTGCQNIIADGLRGTDDVEVPVPNGVICKTAFIGRAIMDADIVLSLNHAKGHEGAGLGAAIKNIGMGSGSRAGKMNMHNDGKPVVNAGQCKGCKVCARFCNHAAIGYGADKKASIDLAKCVGCGRCIGSCSFNAISNPHGDSHDRLNAKMAEYTAAVLQGRPHFHVSVVNQVSPYCDCHGESDAPIVPDIGIFAGFDPVALDKACGDAIAAAPAIGSSILSEREAKSGDHLTDVHPTTNWKSQITHAEKIGLGCAQYELIQVS
jgi:uncharacterized Fe-S center protein